MIKDQNISIHNIYYLFAYAFGELHADVSADIQGEKFEHIYDLFAYLYQKEAMHQVKKGLFKEYRQQKESLSCVRGKIDLSASISRQSMSFGYLVCSFDEYTDNCYLNQVVKTIGTKLISMPQVKKEYKQQIKKILLFFDNITSIPLKSIRWNQVIYTQNNKSYQYLMTICYFIGRQLIACTSEGKDKFQMHAVSLAPREYAYLYEKFVLGYYRVHYPILKASPSYVSWNLTEDSDNKKYLPAMRTDITLTYQDYKLIIDTKYYQNTMQQNPISDKQTFISHNLYQIFAYVKNSDHKHNGKTEGMLLYAKTDDTSSIRESYIIDGSRIRIWNLDLNTPFPQISATLNQIADHFISNASAN